MASYFEGASDFEIRSLRVENIHGDYIDERNTVINDHEVSRATYNQEGVLGVVNDRGTFRGTINCTRRLPTGKGRRGRRERSPNDMAHSSES